MAQTRLKKEFADLQKEVAETPECGYEANLRGDSLFTWVAKVKGPSDTPYAGGTFEMNIDFPKDYPMKPPKVNFVTRIYHPNVSSKGAVCLDTLTNDWSPANKVSKILLVIRLLLSSPNSNDALMPEIAKQYNDNRAKYNDMAKQWTEKYAICKK